MSPHAPAMLQQIACNAQGRAARRAEQTHGPQAPLDVQQAMWWWHGYWEEDGEIEFGRTRVQLPRRLVVSGGRRLVDVNLIDRPKWVPMLRHPPIREEHEIAWFHGWDGAFAAFCERQHQMRLYLRRRIKQIFGDQVDEHRPSPHKVRDLWQELVVEEKDGRRLHFWRGYHACIHNLDSGRRMVAIPAYQAQWDKGWAFAVQRIRDLQGMKIAIVGREMGPITP